MRFKAYLSLFAVVGAFWVCGIAMGDAQTPSVIETSHPWSRATNGTASGVVYLTVTNHGTVDDVLTQAATPIAKTTQFHLSAEENGVMTMRPVSSVPVKAGASVDFKPEGLHVMLMGLSHPLEAGQSFPLTLTFEKAGTVQAMVMVEKAGEATGEMMDHHHTMPGMN